MDELTALLLRAQGGSSRALERFVQATQPEVWRFCAHLIGQPEADDATQETYLAAWKALSTYRGDSSARTWIFSIARRTALRTARRRRRWNELVHRGPTPDVGPGPDQAVHVRELLADLEPDRRSAFVLTQLLGFSYAETAQICDCPVGTIRSRVARARTDLISSRRSAEVAAGEGAPS